jgi:hypothetical protein
MYSTVHDSCKNHHQHVIGVKCIDHYPAVCSNPDLFSEFSASSIKKGLTGFQLATWEPEQVFKWILVTPYQKNLIQSRRKDSYRCSCGHVSIAGERLLNASRIDVRICLSSSSANGRCGGGTRDAGKLG